MSTINDTDQFLVQRGSTSYKQSAVDLMSTIQDTDLMLIQRGTESFKVTCEDVKDQLGGGGSVAPVLDSVTLAQNPPVDANRYTGKSFTTTATASGGVATTLEMTGTVTGNLNIKAGSDPITANAYPGTSSTDVVLTLEGETNLGDVIEVGDTVTANTSYTPETDTIKTVESADIRYLGDWLGATEQTGDIWPGGGGIGEMFNGTETPYSPGGANQYATVTFDPPIPTTTLQLRATTSNQNSNAYLVINGIDYGSATRSYPLGGNVTNSTATWTTIPNAPETITTLGIGWKNSWSACSGIRINGTQLRQGIPLEIITGNKKLTLDSEKDIKLFQVDDAVQSGNGWNQSEVWSTTGTVTGDGYRESLSYPGVFNGVNDNADENSALAAIGELDYRYTFGTPLTVNSDIEVYFERIGDGSITFNKGEIDELVISSSTSGIDSNATQTYKVSGISSFKNISIAKHTGPYLIYISVDGKVLVDTGIPDPNAVKVISTDPGNSQIVVDGGNWDTSNQSQVWSSMTTATEIVAGTIQDIYNGISESSGLPNSYCKIQGGGDITLTPAADFTNVNNFKICVSSSNEYTVKFNNDDTTTQTYPGSGIVIRTIPCPSTISKVEFAMASGAGFYLSQIFVNESQLIDAVNDSQVWSNSLSVSDGRFAEPAAKAFNGDLSSSAVCSVANASIIFTTSSFSSGPYDIEVTADHSHTVTVDGAATTKVGDSGNATFSITVNSFTNITVTASGSRPDLAGIKVNGRILLDKGIRGFGDTKVSTASPKQGSGTVSDITGAQVTVTPFTDNCFKEGQYLTVNKSINVSPVTDPIESYAKDTKTLTFDEAKDLVQFANGDPVTMVNADGTAATYNAETSEITNVEVPEDTLIGWFSNSGWNGPGSLFRAPVEETQAGGRGVANGGTITFSPAIQNVTKIEVLLDNNIAFPGSHSASTSIGVISKEIAGNIGKRWETLYSDSNTPVNFLGYNMKFVQGGDDKTCDTYAFRINGNTYLVDPGVQHTDTSGTIVFAAPDEITLTFEDSTNLQYFEDGDVVGYEGEGAYGAQAWCDADYTDASKWSDGNRFYSNAFDTSADTFCSPRAGLTVTVTYPDNYWYVDGNLTAERAGNCSISNTFEINGISRVSQFAGDQVLFSNGYIKTIKFSRAAGNDGVQFSRFLVNGVPVPDAPLSDVTVIGTPTLDPPQMVVSGGTWTEGDTITKSMSGTGTVDSVDLGAKTMVLSASNDQWVNDYHVATPTKPAVATTAYLKFSSAGAVTGYQATPVEPRAMDSKSNPALFFPSTFPDTGTAPDTEFPDASAFIQTSVQLKNSQGDSATKASNQVVPQTNVRLIGPGEVDNNVDEIKAMGAQIATHDQRVADHTAAQRQQRIDDFEANLRRYAP